MLQSVYISSAQSSFTIHGTKKFSAIVLDYSGCGLMMFFLPSNLVGEFILRYGWESTELLRSVVGMEARCGFGIERVFWGIYDVRYSHARPWFYSTCTAVLLSQWINIDFRTNHLWNCSRKYPTLYIIECQINAPAKKNALQHFVMEYFTKNRQKLVKNDRNWLKTR